MEKDDTDVKATKAVQKAFREEAARMRSPSVGLGPILQWAAACASILAVAFLVAGPIRQDGAAEEQRVSAKRDLDLLTAQLSALSESIRNLNHSLNQEIRHVNDKLAKIEGAYTATAGKIEVIQSRIDTVRERHDEHIQDLKGQLFTAANRLDTCRKNDGVFEARIRILEGKGSGSRTGG